MKVKLSPAELTYIIEALRYKSDSISPTISDGVIRGFAESYKDDLDTLKERLEDKLYDWKVGHDD